MVYGIYLSAQNEKGNPLQLSRRQGGDYQVHYATLKMRKELTQHGAVFDVGKNIWTVPAKDIRRFLKEFYPAKANLDTFESSYGEEDMLASPTTLAARGVPVNPKKQMQRERFQHQKNLAIPPPKGLPVTTKAKDQMGPRQLRQYLEKALNIPIRVGAFNTAKAWGLYYLASRPNFKPGGNRIKNHPEMVRTAVSEDITVISHEVGHHIAIRILGLDLKDPRWRAELIHTGHATIAPSYNLWQKVNEGAAEFFRMWMTDRAAAFNSAPNFAVAFTDALKAKPEIHKVLLEAQRQMHGFVELDHVARLKSRIDTTGDDIDLDTRNPWQKLRAALINKYQPLDDAVHAMAPNQPLRVTQDAGRLARLSHAWVSAADTWIEHGVRDGATLLAPGLNETLKPVLKRMDDFVAYVVARRAIELHAREDVVEWAIEEAWARTTVEKFQSPEFDKAADGLYQFEAAIKTLMVKAGLLSQKASDAMDRMNKFHVPWMRVVEAVTDGHGANNAFADLGTFYKRIKGSGKDIINPIESIVKNAYIASHQIAHNPVALSLFDLSNQTEGSGKFVWEIPHPRAPVRFNLATVEKEIRAALKKDGVTLPPGVDLNALATVWVPTMFPDKGKYYLTARRNGKVIYGEVKHKALFDILTVAGPQVSGAWAKLLNWAVVKPATVKRKAVVLSPSFIFRNLVRDPWVAMIQSKYGWTGQKAEGWERFTDIMTTPYDIVSGFSEAIELAPRMGEFRLAIQAKGEEQGIWKRVGRTASGKNDGTLATASEDTILKAGLAGRELTLDFQQGGDLVLAANKGVPFLNAKFLGFSRMWDTFKERPVHAVTTAMLLPLVTVLARMTWAGDDDDEQLYSKFNAEERNQYWFFRAPWTESGFIAIAKPHEYAAIFANTLEAFLDSYQQKDPAAFRRAMQGLTGTRAEGFEDAVYGMVGSLMPVAFLAILEMQANYSFGLGRALSPTYGQEDLGPDQYLDVNRWTSQTARQLGRMIHFSPVKLDHLFYSVAGNTARGHVQVFDTGLAAVGLSPKMPPRGPSGWWGVGGGYRDPKESASTPAINRLYDADATLRGLERTRLPEQLMEGTAIGDFSRLQGTIAENATLLRQSTFIRDAVAGLAAERRNIDMVLANPMRLTPGQQRQMLRGIYDKMDNAARWGLGEPVTNPATSRLPVQPLAR
jgi:hypothetical protein